MKLSDAQRAYLRRLAGMARSRAVPFFAASEVNGRDIPTARALVRAGLVEWREGADEFGTVALALWLTDAGRAWLADNTEGGETC